MPVSDVIKKKKGNYSEEFCGYILYCIAQGIKALHDMNVIHRNICPENVYCIDGKAKINGNKSNMVFLTDLEASRRSKIYVKGFNAAPEVFESSTGDESEEGYGKAVDVWSLGSLAYELATGSLPYSISTRMSQIFQRNSFDETKTYRLPNEK